MRPLSPAELGERAAKQEYESYMRQTNFKTIKETKDEIKKVAENMLEDIGELYQIVQNLTRGYDPEKEIRPELYSRSDGNFVNFNGLSDKVRNDLGLLWEYRNDINTLQGRGQKDEPEIDEPPEDRKNQEFLSENLNDER